MEEIMEINKLFVRLLEEIEDLSELFYQNRRNEAYQNLDVFLQTFLKLIDELQHYGSVKKEEIEELNVKLQEILEALEAEDCVLAADILQYDLTEQLEQLKHSINE